MDVVRNRNFLSRWSCGRGRRDTGRADFLECGHYNESPWSSHKSCAPPSCPSHGRTYTRIFLKMAAKTGISVLIQLHYQIDLESVVMQWINELMMGYMGIDSIAFFIDCLLKLGWNYVYKLILSYFEKRMEKMNSD